MQISNIFFRNRFSSLSTAAEQVYQRYITSGKTYRDAQELKRLNLQLRELLQNSLSLLPPHLKTSATILINHYDCWLHHWENHSQSCVFKEDSTFIFESPNRFPLKVYKHIADYAALPALDILFIGKKEDNQAAWAAEYLKQFYPDTIILFGKRGEKFPEELMWWQGDYILSYLSPWIIPATLLQRARISAINWHPGPPEYPGIGCTNFAIYNNESQFGITCHHMDPKVDTGRIIEVRRFPILAGDTVYSITQKCYSQIQNSFLEILSCILQKQPLPESNELWRRKPFTRKELNALCEIDTKMSADEINQRILATTYDRSWAYVPIHGLKFNL